MTVTITGHGKATYRLKIPFLTVMVYWFIRSRLGVRYMGQRVSVSRVLDH